MKRKSEKILLIVGVTKAHADLLERGLETSLPVVKIWKRLHKKKALELLRGKKIEKIVGEELPSYLKERIESV